MWDCQGNRWLRETRLGVVRLVDRVSKAKGSCMIVSVGCDGWAVGVA